MQGLHGEQQNMLKQELREELLQEFATPTSLGGTQLRPMAPLLVRSDATVGVVLGEGTGGGDSTGTGDAPGGGIDSSHVNGNTTHSLQRREAISVRGGPYGKLAWYAYRTQFELLIDGVIQKSGRGPGIIYHFI